MGEVRVDIDLENAFDREMVYRGLLAEGQVRAVRIPIIADSGAVMLMLPQEVVEVLGLREVRKAIVTYADNRKEERPIAGVVTVRVGNRAAEVNCIVGPPNSDPLLGQIPLEEMDLLVDCGGRRWFLAPNPHFCRC